MHPQKQLLQEAESKVFSQFNEDGILAMLLNRIGAGTKRFIEFGVGNGKECNTANLSINAGWSGLLMDGNTTDIEKAQRYYASRPQIQPGQITAKSAYITIENINALISDYAGNDPIDFLSIDIDGNDLWVWRAIDTIQPRIVAIEYNASFGPTRSITVKYAPQFDRHHYHESGLYHGASLGALAKIGREKNHILVGCESHGVNAFFVQADLAKQAGLVELKPEDAYYEHTSRIPRFGQIDAQFEVIRRLEFVEI